MQRWLSLLPSGPSEFRLPRHPSSPTQEGPHTRMPLSRAVTAWPPAKRTWRKPVPPSHPPPETAFGAVACGQIAEPVSPERLRGVLAPLQRGGRGDRKEKEGGGGEGSEEEEGKYGAGGGDGARGRRGDVRWANVC